MSIELVTTDGVFALDGGEWAVTNNIWLVGDDREVVVFDAAHDHEAIIAAVNGRRVPAIVLAARGGYAEAIELLVSHGARVDTRDRDGSTALFQAAQRGHDEAVSALVKAKAALEIEGPQGETALIAAARRGHASVVAVLVKAGADWRRQDHTGRTALRHAQDGGRTGVVTVLKRAGATQ